VNVVVDVIVVVIVERWGTRSCGSAKFRVVLSDKCPLVEMGLARCSALKASVVATARRITRLRLKPVRWAGVLLNGMARPLQHTPQRSSHQE
jgi:hypothetical protein